MNYIYRGAITLLFLGVVIIPNTHAEAATSNSQIDQINALIARIVALQNQLASARGDAQSLLMNNLREGMTHSDIRKIQELLATDLSIYPQGLVTGYFGPMTRDALKRFQLRHGVAMTGTIDADTHDLLEEYLNENFGGSIPFGLLRAPGIAKKIEARFRLGCEKDNHGMGPLCKKFHNDGQNDNDDDDNGTDAQDSAEEAIDDAEDAINDAEDAIDDATGNTDDAEDLLEEARDRLDDAEEAYDDEDYDDSEDFADEARELAEDAEDEA